MIVGCVFSTYDQESTSHQKVSAARLSAERLLCEAAALDAQLQNLVSRRLHGSEGVQHLMSLR